MEARNNFTGTPYVSQYVGLPMDAFVQSAGALQQRYDTNVANMDQYDILAANLKTLDADAGVKNKVIQAAKSAIADIAASGDYEHAGAKVSMLAKQFTANPELNAALDNAKRYAALQEDFKKKGVGVHQQQKLIDAVTDYKGIGEANKFGNYSHFGSHLSTYEDQDFYKRAEDVVKDWKADKTVVETSDGKWLNKVTNEIVNANELRKYATESLLNDPVALNQLIDETRYKHGNSKLSGEELKTALLAHVGSYVEPVAQKYGYNNVSVDKVVDPYAMNAVTSAQEDNRQLRGFAHAEKMKAIDQDTGFNAVFPGGIFNAQSTLPETKEEYIKGIETSDASRKALTVQLAAAKTADEKIQIGRRIAAIDSKKQVLEGIRQEYDNTQFKNPRDRAIMHVFNTTTTYLTTGRGSYVVGQGIQAPKTTLTIVDKQAAIRKLADQGIILTDAQYNSYLTRKTKAEEGFSDYLKAKRETYIEQPVIVNLPLNDKQKEEFSAQMQASGDYHIRSENGEDIASNGRKFKIEGMATGNIAGFGVTYSAMLEPTVAEKKDHPEMVGKRVTIVPSLADKNYLAFANILKNNAKTKEEAGMAKSLLEDEFAGDVAAVAHSPYDNVGIDVNRPYQRGKGEVRNLHIGTIKRVPVTPGSDVFHYELKFGDHVETYSSEKQLKTALTYLYDQSKQHYQK